MPLPLYALQTGGDNLAGSVVVAPCGWHRKWEECSEISSSVHEASAELIGEVSRRDGGVGDRASTPSSRCATPPMCSANRGRQSCQPACGSLVGMQKMSSSVHGALAELIGEVSRRDGGVRDTASTPSSLRATPPICSANRGRQSCQPVAWGSSDRKDAWSGSETPRNMYKATEANRV